MTEAETIRDAIHQLESAHDAAINLDPDDVATFDGMLLMAGRLRERLSAPEKLLPAKGETRNVPGLSSRRH